MRGSKGRKGAVPGATTRGEVQAAGLAGPRPIASAVALALFALNGMHPQSAYAAPAGETLVGGAATVLRPNAQTTVIEQSSQRAALNWTRFGIAAGESVIFRQPSASAVALNRVMGSEASHIYGSLQANGQVFLVNPNGVTFARGASVDVGGIVASTLGITNNDFMAGRYVFSGGSNAGAIENHANIRAANGGYVAFLGNQVTNTGTITAPNGTVALGAGDTMQLDFHGDGLLTLRVDAAAANAKLENSGVISADGGQVFLTARAKNALVSTAINMDGVITAKGLTERNGRIVLDGGRSAVTRVSGTLDASSANAGEKGGEVRVLGEYVGLFGNARLDASGMAGGGTVLVGGDYQGRNPDISNAFRTYVGPGATIRADAVANGNGGKVIVWADDRTAFNGTISARGGFERGDGGFVEVSGKQVLAFNGSVDTRAPNGKTGTLLLDPATLTIVGGAGGSQDANLAAGDDVLAGDADTGGNTVSEAALEALAATANVILEATGQITVDTLSDGVLAMAQTGAGSFRMTSTTSGGITFVTNTDRIRTEGGAITLQAQGTGSLSNLGGLDTRGAGGAASGAITLESATSAGLAGPVTAGSGTVNVTASSGAISSDNSTARITTTGAVTLAGVSVGSLAAPVLLDLGNTGTVSVTSTGVAGAGNIGLSDNAAAGLKTSQITALTTDPSVQQIAIEGAGAGGITVDGNIGNAVDTLVLATGGKMTEGAGIVTGAQVLLSATNGVGTSAAARVNTNADQLQATANTNGVFVNETNAVELVGGLFSNIAGGAAAYDLLAGGTITVTGDVNPSLGGLATGNTTLRASAGNIVLGASVGNGPGDVVLTSDAGSVTRTAGTVLGNNVTLDSATGVGAVGARVNTTATTLAARSTTSGDVFVSESDPVTLNTIGGVGNGAAGFGAYDLLLGAGATVVLGPVNTAGSGPTTLAGPASIALQGGAPVGNAVSPTTLSATGGLLDLGTSTVLGGSANVVTTAVSLTGVGISQSAGGIVDSRVGGIIIDANDGAINMAGLLTTNNVSPAAVIIRDATSAALGNINAPGAVVTLGTGGADQLSGAVTQNAGTVINTGVLTGNTGGTVDLSNANTITALNIFSSNGAFTLNDLGGLVVNGNATTGNAGLASITTSGTLTVGGQSASISGAGVALTATAGGDITLNGAVNGNAGNVMLNAAGLISQNATGLINTTAALTGGAGTTAVLNQANTLGALGNFATNGVFTLNDAGGLNVTGVVTTQNNGLVSISTGGTLMVSTGSVAGAGVTLSATGGGSNITLNGAVNGNAGNVALNAAGLISQTATGTINTSGTLTTTSAGGTTLDAANTVGSFNATNTASGNVTFTNTASPLTLTGISQSGGGNVSVSNTGDLTVAGDVSAGGTVTLTAAGANSLLTNNANIASTTGLEPSVALNADRMALAGGNIATTAGGVGKVPMVALSPVTAGQAISIGGADAAGTLGLTLAELNTVHATTLRVGNSDSGAITIDSNVVLSAFDNLHLRTGTTITGITSSLGVSGLLLEAASANISNPSNEVITLAGRISGAGSPFIYSGDGSGVIIGTISGVSGIMTNDGNVNVTTTGAITVNAPIVAGAATVAFQGSSITSNGTTGSVTASTLNTVSTTGSTLLNALGNDVTTYSGQANTAGSTITFVDTNGFNVTGIAAAGSEARLLAATGAVTQTAGTITAGQLTVIARDSSSLALAGNDIGTLSASLTGAGQSLAYRDSNAFTAGISGFAPAPNAIQTNGGNVTLTADTGTLTIADPIAAAGATVSLNATAGGIAQNAAAGVTAATLAGTAGTTAVLTGNNAITNLGAFTTNGALTLTDAGGLNVTGPVTTQNGGLASIATSGTLALTTGSVSGAGVALTTTAGGDITLNAAVNANAGDVALNSAGLISQTATGLINTTGTLTGSAATTATLDQANTVGSLGPFTAGGNFTLNDATGGLALAGAVDAGAGSVSITTAGGPLALLSNLVSGIAGAILQGVGVTSSAGSVISTTAAASSGTPSGAVQVTATGAGAIALGGNINASGASSSGAAGSAGGNVTLTTANGPITVATVNASGGDGTGGNASGGEAGTIVFNVGGANPLTLNGNVISRGGDAAGSGNAGSARSLSIAAPTLVGGDVTVSTRRGIGAGAATGGSIAFASAIDADAAAANRKLTVDAVGGAVAFSGNIGASQALADLDVTASSIVFNATGAQSLNVSAQGGNTASFAGPVTLAQNLAVNTTGAGVNNVTFANAVSADAFGNNRTLNVATGAGSATFGDGVGTGQELGAFTVAGNQLVMSGDVRVTGGGAVDFTNLANMTFTPGASIDTDRAGGATAAGNILFGAATRANPTALAANWTLDANADGGAAAGNVRLGVIGDATGLGALNVTGDRVTFAGPANAVQVFVTANRVETTGVGRIFATRGFDGTSEANVALSLRALSGEGTFGERNAPIQIAAPGLFFVFPNGSNVLSPVFLAGDPNLRPVYQFAEDPSARAVFYNGAAPDSPANRSAQSAITQQLRQLLDEINLAGFSKENIRRQLLQGVILETGLSRPGIDDFVGEGVTAPPACNAVVTAGGKIDCP